MDFRFSQQDNAFRREVGEFVESELPWDWRERAVDAEEPEDAGLVREFKKKLATNGWLTMAVVDQYGKVHGVEGLRVVDASIMPDCVRANINVTTMMIGERIADFVKAKA